jgi:ribosome-binding factor A
MSIRRIERINELLLREIAGLLHRIMNERGFDMSAVTVTRVLTSSDLRHARVMISIRAAAGQQQAMLRQIAHHRKEIQEFIGKNVVIKYTPHLEFELDESIAKGDRVLHILSELEASQPEEPGEPGAAAPDDEQPS